MKLINNKKGFTLMETVLYVGIIGMTVGAFITFILMISGLRNKYHAIEEIQANKRAVQEILYYYVRNAKSVISPGKLSSDVRLEFYVRENLSVHSFYVKDGLLVLDNGATTTPLVSNDVVVSDINFSNLSATGTPDVLQITGKFSSFSSSSIEYMYEDNFRYNVSLPE